MIEFGIREVVASDSALLGTSVGEQSGPDVVAAAAIRQVGTPHCLVMQGAEQKSESAEIWRKGEMALLCPRCDSPDEVRSCFVFDVEALPVAVLGWLSPALSTLGYSPDGDGQIELPARPEDSPDWWFRYLAVGRPMVGVERFGDSLIWTEQTNRDASERRMRVGSSQMIDLLVGEMAAGLVSATDR